MADEISRILAAQRVLMAEAITVLFTTYHNNCGIYSHGKRCKYKVSKNYRFEWGMQHAISFIQKLLLYRVQYVDKNPHWNYSL